MMKTGEDFAVQTAIELAKTNIESTVEWVSPEDVKYFIEEVYTFLTGEKAADE